MPATDYQCHVHIIRVRPIRTSDTGYRQPRS